MPTLLNNFPTDDYNAVYSAIIECGIDDAIERKSEPDDRSCYFWMEHTPIYTMTAHLVAMLKKLGFEVRRTTPVAATKEGETLPAVGGRLCEWSLNELEHRCLVTMMREQEKPLPDNGLIAVLCNAVRLAREQSDWLKSRTAPNSSDPLQPVPR